MGDEDIGVQVQKHTDLTTGEVVTTTVIRDFSLLLW